MKNLLKLAVFLLIFSGVASSCNPEPDKEYPQNISFTEYSLPETSCHWMNLPYDDKVLMINNNEELEKYISCAKGSYPAIDFSKNTLLLVSGKTTSGIIKVNPKDLQQLSTDKYKLNIEIDLFDNTNINYWNTALFVNKMNKENSIDLNVALLTPTYEMCNCIMDTLRGEWSWVKKSGGFTGHITDNEFKSIIKILRQNEDGSINYEVFVEDTLFYRGNFHILYHQYYRKADLILPHEIPLSVSWYFSFKNEWGVSGNDTWKFWFAEADGYEYCYQKINGKL